MRRAVCPGSFDPITFGHLDIIARASAHFDHVVIAVLENRTKSSLFSVAERIEMIQETTSHLSNVSVDSWSGLLVDYCKSNSIQAIVKGLRAVSDFDYELQMAQVNLQGSGVETLELLDEARAALPNDLESAQKLIAARDAIIEEGRVSAEQMIAMAREDVARMVEQTSIVQMARDEARKILDEARTLGDQEKLEVEEYIDGRLATLEVILNKTQDAVARGRERLAGANDKDVLSQLSDAD